MHESRNTDKGGNDEGEGCMKVETQIKEEMMRKGEGSMRGEMVGREKGHDRRSREKGGNDEAPKLGVVSTWSFSFSV